MGACWKIDYSESILNPSRSPRIQTTPDQKRSCFTQSLRMHFGVATQLGQDIVVNSQADFHF
jgi:hypothetical protein